MKRNLLSTICVLLVAGICIIASQTSDAVIAGAPESDLSLLKADKLHLQLSTSESAWITNAKLVELGDEMFVAGNDMQQPKKTRYFSLRHVVEVVGYSTAPESEK